MVKHGSIPAAVAAALALAICPFTFAAEGEKAAAPSTSTATAASTGAHHHVGPGQKCEKVADVPWEALEAGDTVYIHWRSPEQGGDYHEKVNLTRAGAEGKPIRIVGVKGPNGERPCLNGTDAVTRTVDPDGNSTHFPGNQQRGVLCFSSRAKTPDDTPGADYWEVSGLKITGARPANDFTDSYGRKSDYQRAQGGLGSAGAGVFVDRGNWLHFSDMELTDNNNGFFASSDNRGTTHRHVHDIIIEKSMLYGNGAPDNASVHNAYVEIANWTVRCNYFGPLVNESGGSHIKDRGANTVIENNFFDGTAVPLFLDPPEYSEGWMENQPGFDRLTLRNNVIRKDENLPVNAMDIICVGFGMYGDFHTVRTVDVSRNTFIISTSQRQNWSYNVIDLMAYPQVIKWDNNVFLRYVDEKDAAPSWINFVAKIDPVDERTIIDIGPNNYMSGQPEITRQKEGNGSATIKGWENLKMLPAMTREELEARLGINLQDPLANDFGRFAPEKSAWHRENKAGAIQTEDTRSMPMPSAAPVAANAK